MSPAIAQEIPDHTGGGLEPLTTILGWAQSVVAGQRVRLPESMGAFPSIEILMRAVGFHREQTGTEPRGRDVWIRDDEAETFIRWTQPSDVREICRLHGVVFDTGFDGPMYHWRYGGWRGWGLGVWSRGELAGHIGMMRRRIWWEGRPLELAQMGDVMVAPDHRGGWLGQQYRLLALLVHGVGGAGPGIDRIFGFPRVELLRLGCRQGLQRAIGRMVEYRWSAQGGTRPAGYSKPLVLPRDAGVVDYLWGVMCSEQAQDLIGERTAAYIQWRYVEHPANRYSLRLVRDAWFRRPVGILVFRVDGERLLLMDVIGRLESLPPLVAWARFHAAEAGAAYAALWLMEGHAAAAARLPVPDCVVPLMPVAVSTGASRRDPDPTLNGHWWLAAGDIDHV